MDNFVLRPLLLGDIVSNSFYSYDLAVCVKDRVLGYLQPARISGLVKNFDQIRRLLYPFDTFLCLCLDIII